MTTDKASSVRQRLTPAQKLRVLRCVTHCLVHLWFSISLLSGHGIDNCQEPIKKVGNFKGFISGFF
ncbi:hypothetical protein [Mastigocladopsis repens]|uniref:hypothetical protein n=1 Tax=Mastigocladopsis repens TaxID=221287 RepID=UPI0002FF31CC|nr:hypothetical protein [Mastigocladopsis repens]